MKDSEYDIQETIIAKKIYKTKDGKSFDNKQEAYEYSCKLFVQDMLKNIQKLDMTDFKVQDLFYYEKHMKHIEFKTKKEALMFLDDYTKNEYFINSQEIRQQVQERKDFPCIICWSYNELFFKEDLIDRIENVLNIIREEL